MLFKRRCVICTTSHAVATDYRSSRLQQMESILVLRTATQPKTLDVHGNNNARNLSCCVYYLFAFMASSCDGIWQRRSIHARVMSQSQQCSDESRQSTDVANAAPTSARSLPYTPMREFTFTKQVDPLSAAKACRLSTHFCRTSTYMDSSIVPALYKARLIMYIEVWLSVHT